MYLYKYLCCSRDRCVQNGIEDESFSCERASAMGFGINYKNACLGDINLVLWVRKLMVKNNNKMCS